MQELFYTVHRADDPFLDVGFHRHHPIGKRLEQAKSDLASFEHRIEKFYREETGARKKSFRRQAALRSAAGNGPNHDQEKVSRGWQAGDEWAAFRGLARYPGRGYGVEDLNKVAARWDIEDKLTRERLTLASPRFAPQPELIGSRQESEPSDPGRKASDSATRSAPQRSGIE